MKGTRIASVSGIRGWVGDGLDPASALEFAAAHGCHPLRGVANYQDVYRLTYLRGPSGIVVMLAQDLRRNPA